MFTNILLIIPFFNFLLFSSFFFHIFFLSQITSVQKIYTFIGAPVSDIVASFAENAENSLESDEYCHVLSNSDWLLQINFDGDQLMNDEANNCFFTVRGHGLEEDGICNLAAACMFEALGGGVCSDVFEQNLPRNIADAPVTWTITHDANATEQVIRFIESNIPGVKFVYHLHDDNGIFLSPDDVEMSQISSSLCIHPTSNPSGEIDGGSHGTSHSGSLLGLDVQLLVSSIQPIDENDPRCRNYVPPYDFMRHFRSVEERYSFFTFHSARICKIVDSYKTTQQMHGESKDAYKSGCEYDERRDSKLVESDAPQIKAGKTTSSTNKINPGGSHLKNNSNGSNGDDEYKDIKAKIVDLGNACYTYKHFTDDIQTRQYRAPEVIIGANYSTSADIWSLACIIFELLVGDLMFDPQTGKNWHRDEDHLAMIIELIGPFPKRVYTKGKHCSKIFHQKNGELKHISQLKFWSLRDVLHDKYKFSLVEANGISSFLLPMLEIDQESRATALELLEHPWLDGTPFDEYDDGRGERIVSNLFISIFIFLTSSYLLAEV